MPFHCECSHNQEEHQFVKTQYGLMTTFIEFLKCLVEGCPCGRYHQADF